MVVRPALGRTQGWCMVARALNPILKAGARRLRTAGTVRRDVE